MSLLNGLIEAGLTLETRGADLLVSPHNLITAKIDTLIAGSKPTLWRQVREAEIETAALIASINRCCDARGDDDSNRAGLIADCKTLTLPEVKNLTQHFDQEAARWLRATGQTPR